MRTHLLVLAAALCALVLGVSTAVAGQPQKQKPPEEKGRDLFEQHCVACHGPGNRGDGPATEALVAEVPDLRGKVKANDETIKLVQRGKGSMPAYNTTLPKRGDVRLVLQHMAKVHAKGEGSTQRPAKKPKPEPPADDEATEGDAQGDAQGAN